MTITKQKVAKLEKAAAARWGDRVMVDFCMRYGNPSTQAVVERMVKAGCDRIVFLPMYPQYAGATWATANDQFFRALMTQKWQPSARVCLPYFDRPDYIEALAQSVERTLAGRRPQKLVASYHGMPRRYLMEGDPYHANATRPRGCCASGWAGTRMPSTPASSRCSGPRNGCAPIRSSMWRSWRGAASPISR